MSPATRLGLAISASTAAYAAATALPAVAAPLLVLAPLPGLLVGVQVSAAAASAWCFLAGTTIGTVLGGAAAIGFLLPIAFPALALVLALRAAWSFDRAVVTGVVVWYVGVIGVLLAAYGNPERVLQAAQEQISTSFDLAVTTSRSMGAPESTLTTMEGDRDSLVTGLVELLPGFLLLTGAAFILINVLLLRAWCGVYGSVNLRLWRAPDRLIWLLIGAGFGMFIPTPPVALAARNIFVVLLGCYFCQGLAIVSYFLVQFRLPRSLRIASYALIAIHQVFAATVLALGVFDFWANFRRLSAGPADLDLRD